MAGYTQMILPWHICVATQACLIFLCLAIYHYARASRSWGEKLDFDETVVPVVAGSNPVALADDNRCLSMLTRWIYKGLVSFGLK